MARGDVVGLALLGEWVDWMVLEVLSNLNNSMTCQFSFRACRDTDFFQSMCEMLVWDGENQGGWVMVIWRRGSDATSWFSDWQNPDGRVETTHPKGSEGRMRGKKWKFDYFMISSPCFCSLDSIFQSCVFQFLFSVGYINDLEEFGMDCSKMEQSSQTLAVIWAWIFLCKPSLGKACYLCRK